MNVRIAPGKLKGTLPAPPSKSFGHRLLIAAALAGEGSVVQNLPDGEDILATRECLSALGAVLEPADAAGRAVRIVRKASGLRDILPCRESASTLRFLIPLALTLGDGAAFSAAPRLMERGISVYETLFAEKGIAIEKSEAVIRISGRLRPGTYTVPGQFSSQYASGLLLALPLLPEESRLTVLPPCESRPYIDITLAVLRQFGIRVREETPGYFFVPGGQTYRPCCCVNEGGWTNAAVFFAFRALGSDISVTGLQDDSVQGDKKILSFLEALTSPGAQLDLSDHPDLGPVLFAAAAALHGGSFTGIRRLRHKESNRIAAMTEELARFGVHCRIEDDRITIPGEALHASSGPLPGHGDHRIIMAEALLLSLTGGEIHGAEAIRKSWPDFFQILTHAGLDCQFDF